MRSILLVLWQLPQSLLGLLFFWWLDLSGRVLSTKRYRARPLVYSVSCSKFGSKTGVSFGVMFFLFHIAGRQPENLTTTARHEYGHSRQSVILGPLYLLVIGLPSIIWNSWFKRYRIKHNISYYSFYTEKWADKLGGVKR